ncbi:hypothetical protein KTC96_24835 (plasmid) [Clostridium estertheticum]|uniref:endonuclease/exonuclease/phosphatase family protein n=1 Tax=Clostridium estertheticum TaxID=238834 RepID=UPI001C7D0C04|nr:hypothetical protein [Clostridium estertheticum]MBX4259755.1 hypothetical protein [Clostridium estertheticum]WLC73250.1 hypothetical protein KTC96_24835 [Clostridium estertheticum]
MVVENQIDILALVESDEIDSNYLISELHKANINYKNHEILTAKSGIMLFSKSDIKISVIKEERHYSVFKVYNSDYLYLLFVVHLISPISRGEEARNERAKSTSKLFEKMEQDIFKDDKYKSIIVGDFNLHPFSSGIIGAHGFNATLSPFKAKKNWRKIDDDKKFFYYNPMWKLMGNDEIAQGTYYNNSDENDKSFYWYTFDQILLRPLLIEQFVMKELKIVTNVNGDPLIKNYIIDKVKYSDHLPIKFEIS